VSDETVRLDISIQIDQHDDNYDTGITVPEWNAMTNEDRSKVYQEAWSTMTEQDNGGVTVLTEGAEGL
jgi:hypothetical protein